MPSSNGASHIVQDTVKPVMICQQCKDVRATTLRGVVAALANSIPLSRWEAQWKLPQRRPWTCSVPKHVAAMVCMSLPWHKSMQSWRCE